MKGPMIYCGNYRCVTEGPYDLQGPVVKDHDYRLLQEEVFRMRKEIGEMNDTQNQVGKTYPDGRDLYEGSSDGNSIFDPAPESKPQQHGDVIIKMCEAYMPTTMWPVRRDGMTAAAKVCTDKRDKEWEKAIRAEYAIHGGDTDHDRDMNSMAQDWFIGKVRSHLLPEGKRIPEDRVTISEGCGDFESWTVALDGRSRVSFGIGGKEDAEVYRVGLIAQLHAADRGQG